MFTPDRRSFLLGTAGIITASFVARAQDWIADNEEPLFLPPRAARQTLWANYFDDQIQFSLGNPDVPDPDPPSWAEYFRMKGHALDMSPGTRSVMADWALAPSDLRKPMDEYTWANQWACNYSPTARAFTVLHDLDLGTGDGPGQWLGELNFHEGDNHPGSSDHWVDTEDRLSVTLLQARLRELGTSIEVVSGMNA